MPFLADTTVTREKDLINKLVQAGWEYKEEKVSSPRKLRNGNRYEPPTVGVFRREIPHPKSTNLVTKKFFVTKGGAKNGLTMRFADGGKSVYGCPIERVAPNGSDASSLSSLSSILSVNRMRQDGNALVLALDTEFYYLSVDERSILTWQLAFVVPSRPDFIQEVVFASTDGARLSISFLLAWIFEKETINYYSSFIRF